MQQDTSQLLIEVMSTLFETKLASLKEVSYASSFSFVLWRLDKDKFPFLRESSQFFLGTGKKDATSMEEFRKENRAKWEIILGCLQTFHIGEWSQFIEEFRARDLDRFVACEEQALQFFCLMFISFLKELDLPISKTLEKLHPQAFTSILARSHSSNKDFKRTHFTPHSDNRYEKSPDYYFKEIANNRDFYVTDKSIQDLLNVINNLQSQNATLRSDLISKEKETLLLEEKVAGLKKDSKHLQAELETRDSIISRLQFKIESLETSCSEEGETLSLKIANNKIEDLYREVDMLQKRNCLLQSRLDGYAMRFQHSPTANLEEQEEELERTRNHLRCSQLEKATLEEKLQVLEQKLSQISEKLLKERDVNGKINQELMELHRVITQKELAISSLANERIALESERDRCIELLQQKDCQMRNIEREYSDIVRSGNESLNASRKNLEQLSSADDPNLELVQVCKQVNKNFMNELKCVYSLLHDVFVTELTGVNLSELVKKRLAESQGNNL
jgi:uncharacterized protein YfkK (UPF0435 family)